MDRTVSSTIFAISLFLGMLLLLEVGRRRAIRERAKGSEKEPNGVAVVEGAVFALFGLLIAFTFSGSVERFDKHRELIAEETNAIGTAYLRLDLLPKSAQPALRELFGKYLDDRLEVYSKLPDIEAAKAALAKSAQLQGEIWTQAVSASRLPDSHPDAGKLLLPALNNMIDITTTREMAANLHPPAVIFLLLFALGLGCSLVAGYGMATSRRSWLHILGFTAVTVITVFVILDIEYPRQGLFRADAYDQVLIDLRESMK
jgi:protein-S-isoprenylcysteine O-methyltransferase Ste14